MLNHRPRITPSGDSRIRSFPDRSDEAFEIRHEHEGPPPPDIERLRCFGAAANNFSSVYLWRHDTTFSDWLLRGGYEIVTDSFGRADIQTFFTLGAFRGNGCEARFLYRDDRAIPRDADLTDSFTREAAWGRDYATRSEIVAVVLGLDPRNWTFVRILLSEAEPEASTPGIACQIAHLSRPLLDTLPREGP
ncbi:hypothetical protein AA12717_1946 [Gluconacetobacter sacchari DSM 12717]|uniref:DUF4865 family protein n=2 Tax=Gluconacetobacter sacchari TaxID=92759 RepID=A0A7W4NQ32_9PROT|nr:DUF4865 family protein [Gluconacetobacter sacchari]MBB2162042.1 DUF4865 family protein [Gluconacetobacter sacchari]GBQ24984.1 hypothetical protein AA12717_1946 [Gluconacetobacter sacchari DSM 12717]